MYLNILKNLKLWWKRIQANELIFSYLIKVENIPQNILIATARTMGLFNNS